MKTNHLICLKTLIGLFLFLLAFTINGQEKTHIYNLPPGQKPVEVEVHFYLSDLNNINVEKETFEIKGLLELKWKDSRQAFDTLVEGVNRKLYQGSFQFLEVYEGWWPQISISNSVGNTPLEGITLFQHYDGSLQMIQEITVELKSPMDIRSYPFDSHSLTAFIEPLGFFVDEVVFKEVAGKTDLPERDLNIAGWELNDLDYDIELKKDRKSDNIYSQLMVRIDMTRLPGSTILLVFIPLSIIIILSSAIYWMDTESLGDRMDISFLGLLTIVAYQTMIDAGLPDVNYFTFASSFVYSAYILMGLFIISNIVNDQFTRKGKRDVADRFDRRARWIMPLVFILMNILLAIYYI